VSRPSLEVADIFRGHGPAWRRANAGHVSLGQLKVMSAIENWVIHVPLRHGPRAVKSDRHENVRACIALSPIGSSVTVM
jgi:hypothetical protein